MDFTRCGVEENLFTGVIALASGTEPSEAFYGMYGYDDYSDKYYHYVIRYNGDMQYAGTISSTNYDLKTLKEEFVKRDNELNSILPVSPYSDNNGTTLNSKGLEKLFFETLAKMHIDKNTITLQRVDDQGNVSTIQLNNDGTTTPVPCP